MEQIEEWMINHPGLWLQLVLISGSLYFLKILHEDFRSMQRDVGALKSSVQLMEGLLRDWIKEQFGNHPSKLKTGC
ncbi:hypothetical protein [Echinicola salinicaeni]|uniref:hypothetical protein n=1 Tax=Echinicola salinicaeni TaxID=2762757 RepID=UPI001647B933|nr:hypothetical protein [Echinicola salinicaeni]